MFRSEGYDMMNLLVSYELKVANCRINYLRRDISPHRLAWHRIAWDHIPGFCSCQPPSPHLSLTRVTFYLRSTFAESPLLKFNLFQTL